MNQPTCTIEISNKTEYWLVSPVWSGVDRPNVGGYSTGKNYRLAERLAAFMKSGRAWIGTPEVLTDVDGKSYVNASLRINTRVLNAELKRHGF
jgi:hypothetical protein